jgi:protein ImuB
LGQPRAALARRFGKALVLRLDQAMGSAPEAISPARPPLHFAVRLTLPDPIGLKEDVLAGIDRMLPRFCSHLEAKGRGAGSLKLEAHRSDQSAEVVQIGLARPSHNAHRIRPLLEMKLDDLDAGFGIDMLRLEAVETEPLHHRTKVGHLGAGKAVRERLAAAGALEDLIGKLGARVGLEAITRRHPAESHIPEKTALTLAAAWSDPARIWPHPAGYRPMILWPPEPVHVPATPDPPLQFRWRGRTWHLAEANGPERIAPEWWLDDPNWRTGVRDYWDVRTRDGDRLWLYYSYGAALSAGWFCQGRFA